MSGTEQPPKHPPFPVTELVEAFYWHTRNQSYDLACVAARAVHEWAAMALVAIEQAKAGKE